jgi:uncharacterized membrane protein
MTKTLRFIDLLVLALLAGTTFGIWLGYDPADLSATSYVEQQQAAIRGLNTILPAMGAVCIMLTAVLAVLARRRPLERGLLVAAVLCLLFAAVVTRLGNQPINALVMTWSANAVPARWTALRDTWWRWHLVRTVAVVAGFALTLFASLDC